MAARWSLAKVVCTDWESLLLYHLVACLCDSRLVPVVTGTRAVTTITDSVPTRRDRASPTYTVVV